MKQLRKILGICLLLILLFPVSIHADNMDGGNTPSGDSTAETTEKDDTETANFISDALKSLDAKTAEKENAKNYIKNFYNSSVTAKTKGFNLLSPDSIGMCFLNLITTLLEMIGIAFTFLLMLLYNLVSSSFMENVLQSAFDIIDKVMFNWNDPNSWIMKVLLITTLLSILYQLIKNFTRMTSWKHIVQLVVSSFITMTFIIFIGQHGRPIVNGLEKSVNKMLTQSFVYGDEKDPEIVNKENMFDILQVQPFMVRHYGTTSYESIAKSTDQNKVKKAKERVQNILDDPSEANAEKEYDEYGNKVITHNTGSSAQVLFLSVIMLIHRIAIGIVLGVCCLALGAVKFAKTILLGLSVYQLIWWLLKRTGKARQWFLHRLMWSFAAVIADVMFNAALFFLVTVCTKVAAINVLFMLAFDAILIIIIWFVLKNIGTIAAKMKGDGGMVVDAMLKGNSSPLDTFKNIKDSHSNESISDDNESMDTSKLGDDDTYDENLQDSGIEPYESNDEGLADHDDSQNLDNILDDVDNPVPGGETVDDMQKDNSSAEGDTGAPENESENTTEKDDISQGDGEDTTDAESGTDVSENEISETGLDSKTDEGLDEVEDADKLITDADNDMEDSEEDDESGKLSAAEEEDLSEEADMIDSDPDIDIQDDESSREKIEIDNEDAPLGKSDESDAASPQTNENEHAIEESEHRLEDDHISSEKDSVTEQEQPTYETIADKSESQFTEDIEEPKHNDDIFMNEKKAETIEETWDEEN